MKISEVFPSNYLKAEDLKGRRVRAVIASVGAEELSGQAKPVVYFKGKQRGVVLNKTNGAILAADLGDETDDWAGHEVVLFPTKRMFQGRMVDAIGVEVVADETPRVPPKPPTSGSGNAGGGPDLDDEIPFD